MSTSEKRAYSENYTVFQMLYSRAAENQMKLTFSDIPPAEFAVPDVPADVELHVLQAAECVREKHGGGHSPCPQLQVCFSDGEYDE